MAFVIPFESETVDPALEGLEPRTLWVHFDKIRKIPRPSGKEERVMEHLKKWAFRKDFECTRDDAGNMLIKVPGLGVDPSAPPVCLQVHADMVCVSEDGYDYMPGVDPIVLKRDEGSDSLAAKGTSLGADNGVGLAAAMAIADDRKAPHPPLEIFVTVEEETGLDGVFDMDPKKLGITSSIILNLDGGGEGETCVQSAGFQKVKASRDIQRESPEGPGKYFKIKLNGLPGGHSGEEIHEIERGNAIKLLAEALDQFPESVRLVSLKGGQAHNAIPAEAEAVVFVEDNFDSEFREAVRLLDEEYIKAVYGSKSGVHLTELIDSEEVLGVMTRETQEAVISVLNETPNGVVKMSAQIPGLVQTSLNLATVETDRNAVRTVISIRSSVDDEIDAVRDDLKMSFERFDFQVKTDTRLSGWNGDPNSPLVRAVNEAYKRVTNKDARNIGMHAGLETGILTVRLGQYLNRGIDAASIGPTIKNCHSTSEYVKVGTVPVFFAQLQTALRMLAEAGERAVA